MTESFSYGTRDLRIGDAEREAAVQALGEHFVAGRLDVTEHEERIGRAYAAKMGSDLDSLFEDLPRLRPAADQSSSPPRQIPRRRSGFPIPVLLFPVDRHGVHPERAFCPDPAGLGRDLPAGVALVRQLRAEVVRPPALLGHRQALQFDRVV